MSSRPQLPSSASSGSLEATILSAYDLPCRDAPARVSLRVNERVVHSGPPAQRHKDRNSFKFQAPHNKVRLTAPLAELYNAHVTVTVVYANPQHNLVAEYRIDRLQIHTSTWIILTLEPSHDAAGNSAATAHTSNNHINSSNATTPTVASSSASSNNSTVSEMVAPTLRVQFTLAGPYRTEVAALVGMAQSWFRAADALERGVVALRDRLPTPPEPLKHMDSRWLIVPAVPIIAILVVSAPAIAGVLLVCLPMVLPVVAAGGAAAMIVAGIALILYGSTRMGRTQLGGLLSPLQSTWLATRSGQRTVYQTGPRPTPVGLARAILPDSMWQKLFVSLWIDLMGSASYLLPGIGELTDIAWAPLQTTLVMALYDQTTVRHPRVLQWMSFVEEILPFTDIVPTATIGWLLQYGPPLLAQTTGIPEPVQEQLLETVLPRPPSNNKPAAATTATPNLGTAFVR